LREVTIRRAAQVVHLLVGRLRLRRLVYRNVGRADQREASFVRNHENDAPIVVLQDERMVAFVLLRQHDMAALSPSAPHPQRAAQDAH
jgi:hypothetical protein